MDPVQALETSYDGLVELVSRIGADQLGAPTPCSGWDTRALLNHTLGAGWMFTLVNQGQSASEDAGDLVREDPASALSELMPANLAVWRARGALDGERAFPFGTFPAPAALMINVGEIAVHAWDLAQAVGRDHTIDPEVAGMVLDFYLPLPLDQYRAAGAFGAEVTLPAGASRQDQLLAYLGRRP